MVTIVVAAAALLLTFLSLSQIPLVCADLSPQLQYYEGGILEQS